MTCPGWTLISYHINVLKLIGRMSWKCTFSGRNVQSSTLVKSRQPDRLKLPIISSARIWQMATELKIQTTFPICLQTLKLHSVDVWDFKQNVIHFPKVPRSKVDIWQQKNESVLRWQQKANYANSSWSTATWQRVTCFCPWTRSVKSRILASLETSTLMRRTGKKPRENVSKILFI